MLDTNTCFSTQPKTFDFVEKNGQTLKLDVYSPNDDKEQHPCIIFYYEGGFVEGSRNDLSIVKFCKTMAYEHGFVVVAADYRLGLIGEKRPGVFNNKPLRKAIFMATEDAISAIDFVLKKSNELKINKERIIIGGASAGAITALQTDYFICNGKGSSGILPNDFHLAGVISFSGAIFSVEGKVKYKNHTPAPTMFFHGMRDRFVPYTQLRLFHLGFFGSGMIVKQFEKNKYQYFIRRYENYGHSAEALYNDNIDEINWFYENYIEKNKFLQIDERVNYTKNAPKVIWDATKEK